MNPKNYKRNNSAPVLSVLSSKSGALMIFNRTTYKNEPRQVAGFPANGRWWTNQNQSSGAPNACVLMVSTISERWVALDVQERISRILKRIDFFLLGISSKIDLSDANNITRVDSKGVYAALLKINSRNVSRKNRIFGPKFTLC